jgi:hypothetical protein
MSLCELDYQPKNVDFYTNFLVVRIVDAVETKREYYRYVVDDCYRDSMPK